MRGAGRGCAMSKVSGGRESTLAKEVRITLCDGPTYIRTHVWGSSTMELGPFRRECETSGMRVSCAEAAGWMDHEQYKDVCIRHHVSLASSTDMGATCVQSGKWIRLPKNHKCDRCSRRKRRLRAARVEGQSSDATSASKADRMQSHAILLYVHSLPESVFPKQMTSWALALVCTSFHDRESSPPLW